MTGHHGPEYANLPINAALAANNEYGSACSRTSAPQDGAGTALPARNHPSSSTEVSSLNDAERDVGH